MSNGTSIIQQNLFGEEVDLPKDLVARFGVPPFSVLDTRQGYWQDIRKKWLALGIKSEIGRGDNVAEGEEGKSDFGKCLPDNTFSEEKYGKKINQATSVFDPCLTDLMLKWFCPKGGTVIDPFCGGSVRGIVASKLGYKYIGIDLREEQIEANKVQGAAICADNMPTWLVGDSANICQLIDTKADFIFTCPPYYDLEVYSELPGELSNMPTYQEFMLVMADIIGDACSLLKSNRFACFIVGDIRDKKGFYNNFVGDTISAFRLEGLQLYNEAILVNTAGTLPLRINRQFNSYRKLGKMHQNILIFYKGLNPKEIKGVFEVIE
jgi:DNA modification methylase